MGKIKKLIGYGIGDFGLNIYWKTLSLYLLYFYTTVIGLDPRIAGSIFFIGMCWDAISDPIMASLSERVNTRFGTYRPFLLFGSVFLALAFSLLFWKPPFDGTLLILTLVTICIIFRTAYTIVAIPYAALASRLTYDSVERSDYSGARMFFAFLSLLMVSMFFPELKDFFSTQSESETQGFMQVAFLGGIIASLALFTCFLNTKEIPLPTNTVQSEKVWAGIYKNVVNNKSLQILLFVILLNSAASICLGTTLVFFIEANASNFASESVVLTSYAIGTLIFIPIWTFIIHILGRKKVWVFLVIAHLLIGLHLYVFSSVILVGIPVQIILFGCLGGGFSVIFWAFIPDCVEFGQRDSGYRSEAGVFGSVMITQKLSGAFMVLIVGFVLESFGLSGKSGTDFIASAEKLTIFLALCPALLLALTIPPVLLLPLGRKAHSSLIEELQKAES